MLTYEMYLNGMQQVATHKLFLANVAGDAGPLYGFGEAEMRVFHRLKAVPKKDWIAAMGDQTRTGLAKP